MGFKVGDRFMTEIRVGMRSFMPSDVICAITADARDVWQSAQPRLTPIMSDVKAVPASPCSKLCL